MFFEFSSHRPSFSERRVKFAAIFLIGVLHVALWFAFSVISSDSRISRESAAVANETRTTVIWITRTERVSRVISPPDLHAEASKDPAPVPRVSKKHAGSRRYTENVQSLAGRNAASDVPAAPTDSRASASNKNVPDAAKADVAAASPKFDYSKVVGVLKNFDRESSVGRASTSELKESSTEKLGKEISKAKRAHCETAYSHLGLLAIPFLLKDTVTDKGCKW
jgi:hypothetical protein